MSSRVIDRSNRNQNNSMNNNIATNNASLANKRILFIDSQVADCNFLVSGVVPGIETVILDCHQDGIMQIFEIVDRQSALTSIHIVAHGCPGCLYLGNSRLSLDTLNRYQAQLRSWSVSEVLIYGCNVAVGDAGEEFITKIHQLIGGEIAASKTPV